MQKTYYKKPNFTLHKASCLDVLNKMEENSVDMIFADPPYFLSSGSFTCHNGKMVSVKKGDWDLCNGTRKNFEFHLNWIKACKRVLKPNGTIWISGFARSRLGIGRGCEPGSSCMTWPKMLPPIWTSCSRSGPVMSTSIVRPEPMPRPKRLLW